MLSLVPFVVAESAECPCATPLELLSAPLNSTAAARAGINASTYGIGCAPHDAERTICQRSLPPGCDRLFPKPANCTLGASWCASSWCFIGKQCSLLYDQPSLLHDDAIADAAGPLTFGAMRAYSYATCGSENTPSAGPHVAEQLRGKVLRVAFRENSGGWMGSYRSSAVNADGTVFGGWYGPAASFFAAVQDRAGFVVNVTHVPTEVLAASGSNSRFTQCVYAAALGYVDLCIGDFSVTDSRNILTPFYIFDNLPLYLIVPVASAFDPSTSVGFVFSPFQPSVWGVLALMLVFFGLLLSLQEALFKQLGSGLQYHRQDANFCACCEVAPGTMCLTPARVSVCVLNPSGQVLQARASPRVIGRRLLLTLELHAQWWRAAGATP